MHPRLCGVARRVVEAEPKSAVGLVDRRLHPELGGIAAGGVTAEGISNRIKEPGDLPCFNPNTGANLCTPANPFYRITVMVSGPRGTATYAQAVIY